MRIKTPGKIREKLWLLGCEESCIYLLEGSRTSMIVSGGMSYLVPAVLRQFKEFGIDETRVTKLLILHAHFDHIGTVPFLKRRRPEMEIYASARAWEILQMPKAIKTINEFSLGVAKRMGMGEVYAEYDLAWRDDIRGTTVSEDDWIELGDLRVRIIETPGHSSCSISAYAPEIKTLFSSDSGGIPYRDTILSPGNSNFNKYQQSLEKLKDLDVAYACADHYGYVSGEESVVFIQDSIQAAHQHRRLVEDTYARTGSVETTARELVGDFYTEYPDYFLSPEISEGVYRQKVRHIVSKLGYHDFS